MLFPHTMLSARTSAASLLVAMSTALAFSMPVLSAADALGGSLILTPQGHFRLRHTTEWRCDVTPTSTRTTTRMGSGYTPIALSKAKKKITQTRTGLKQALKRASGKSRKNLLKKLTRTSQELTFLTGCAKQRILDFELTYDRDGTPHVSSRTDRGAFFGLGYAHASQRLFQMAFVRLKMEGRLAEFIGPTISNAASSVDLVALDKRYRMLGYDRRAMVVYQRLSPEIRSLLTAFAGGVNRLIAERKKTLPLAFTRLGIVSVEPWKPHHALTVYSGFAHSFVGGGGESANEARFLADVEALGVDAAMKRWLEPARDDEIAVHQVSSPTTTALDLNALGSHLPLSMKASHNWVVAGSRTTVGKPVMVGLPMLPVESRFLYPSHIESPSFHARGVGFAGSPTFLIGFTHHTSWSVTALTADAVDEYTLTPSDASHYLLDGVQTPYVTRNEVINVRGGASLPFVVRESVFGPIVSDLEPHAGGRTIARRDIMLYDAPDGRRDPIEGHLTLMRSRTMDELRDGAWRILYPAVNMLLASDEGSHGSIGYAAVIGMPVRPDSVPLQGLLPIDGSTRLNDWVGLLSKERTPFVRDPESGFLVTANGLATNDPSLYGYGGIGLTDRGWRANTLLRELLAKSARITPEQVAALRLDCANPIIDGLRKLADHLAVNHPQLLTNPTLVKDMVNYLRQTPDLSTNQPYAPLAISILSVASTYFRSTPMSDTFGEAGSGLIHLLRKFELEPSIIEGEYLEPTAAYISRVFSDGWGLTVRSPTDPEKPGFGTDPEQWLTHVKPSLRLTWSTDFTLPIPLDPTFDIETGPLTCIHSGTLRSQRSNTYTQVTVPGRPDLNRGRFALGPADDPATTQFNSTVAAWESGTLAPAHLDSTSINPDCAAQGGCTKIQGIGVL